MDLSRINFEFIAAKLSSQDAKSDAPSGITNKELIN